MSKDCERRSDSTALADGGTETGGVYETIFQTIEDAVFLVDVASAADGYTFTFRRNNEAHRHLTRLSEDDLRGKTPRELLGDEQGGAVAENYRRCVQQRETIEYEETLELPAGRTHWETKLTPIIDDGEVTQIVGISREITERTERERELEYYERIIHTFEDVATVIDADGTITYVSPSVRGLLGYDPEELVGENGFGYQPPDTAAAVEEAIEYVLEHPEESRTVQTRFRKADGSYRWIESVIQNRLDDDVIEGLIVNSRDITERRERQEEIQTLKERLEFAIDGANLGVWDWDMRTDEVEYNDNWARMLGHDPGEIDQRVEAWEQRLHPDEAEFVKTALQATVDGDTERYDTEHRMLTAEGDWKWVHDVGAVLDRDADGEPVRMVGILLDIDERKAYETALESTRDELRQIIDLVPDLIFAKDRDGEYLLANEATADVYGLTPADVEGRNEAAVIPNVEDSEEFRADDLAVIESGERKEIEEMLTTAEGETRTFQTTKIPFEVSGSGDDAVLGYARDVTDLKEYEQILETQRDNLELLNQVVRHDVRNDLHVILAFAEMLTDHVDPDNEICQEYLERVLNAGYDAVEITRTAGDVTDVLLQLDADRSPMWLRSVLETQLEDVRSQYDQARIDVDGSIPNETVLADDMLGSVFRNLLVNAIVHNDAANPEVTVSATVIDETVEVRVADNGPGVPDGQKAQIFEEGEKGIDSDGTGLGLYLVRTLVDRYDGAIWVEDNEPTGSVFVVELQRER